MFTILVGVTGFIFVPSTLRDSQFLTENQKESASNSYSITSLHVLTLLIVRLIIRRLEKDRPSITSADKFSLKEVRRSVGSPHVIMASIMVFMNGMMTYGLAVFLPSIVNQLGFSPNTTQLLSVGPFTTGFIGECFFKNTSHQGIFTPYSFSIFNCCILVGPVREKGYCNYPRFHSRCCRFCSFSK